MRPPPALDSFENTLREIGLRAIIEPRHLKRYFGMSGRRSSRSPFDQLATTLVATKNVFAKLSPSSNSSWAEMAIFPFNPATHPPTGQVPDEVNSSKFKL